MSFLARFRVLTKLVAIVVLLSAIAGGITWLGVSSLKSLSDATDRMESTAEQAVIAQRAVASLLAMNRTEFHLSTDPRPENRKSAQALIDEEAKMLLDQLRTLNERVVRPEHKAMLAEIQAAWEAYQKELDGTFQAASAVRNFQMTAEMDQLRKKALSSATVANKLREKLSALADGYHKEVKRESSEATDE